jgi:hypothetical protein
MGLSWGGITHNNIQIQHIVPVNIEPFVSEGFEHSFTYELIINSRHILCTRTPLQQVYTSPRVRLHLRVLAPVRIG